MMKGFLYLLSLFCFVILMPVSAQELTIKSFIEKTNDLSASTYLRNDLNGSPCALIKVQLASSGALFEGYVVGDSDYKTSEYWVYMPQGSKRLKVKLEGYLPLEVEFGDYGVNGLEPKTTYVLTITGVINNTNQPQQARTQTGWIILDSEPNGAAVYIDEEFVGNTPLGNCKRPYGVYTYRIEKPKYHSVSGTFNLNSGKYNKTEKLSPAFGSIHISGGISGATVLLDGNSTGKTTPCTLEEIPSGSHTITLQKEKYAPRQLLATVTDGNITELSSNLEARFATVTITTLLGAEIYLDGQRIGTYSCTEDLMEGYHDVEVKLAHHKNATKQFKVEVGQDLAIDLKPIPIYGSLDVVSTPMGARVSIDGKNYGETPLTVNQLLEGEHKVMFSLEDYAMEEKMVNIIESQTSTLTVTMNKGHEVTLCLEKDEIYAEIKKAIDKERSKMDQGGTLTNVALENGHEYIDLGLSVKWATCNVGTNKPEKRGDYYAWGETKTKRIYTDANNKWLRKRGRWKFDEIKYGKINHLLQLELEDDVAHVKWGGSWRIPTASEWEELKKKCDWMATAQNGVKGFLVTSKVNGNSIFLPDVDVNYNGDYLPSGGYWSSTLFKYDDLFGISSNRKELRYFGLPVRPVCK